MPVDSLSEDSSADSVKVIDSSRIDKKKKKKKHKHKSERKHKKTKKENGESKLKDKKKSNGDHIQNGKQKRPPSPPPIDISKKKKIEGTITEINLDEEEMNLEELIKQKALLQARLGAYSSESEDGDKGIKNRRPCMKKSVETINLIDDDDSEEDRKNKNLERLRSPIKRTHGVAQDIKKSTNDRNLNKDLIHSKSDRVRKEKAREREREKDYEKSRDKDKERQRKIKHLEDEKRREIRRKEEEIKKKRR